MKLHYYPETDSLYIELMSKPGVETREIAAGLVADFDADGAVVGFDRRRVAQARSRHARNHRSALHGDESRLTSDPNKKRPGDMAVTFRIFAAAFAITFALPAYAQTKLEKPDLVLGVGGKSLLYYLPLTLTERLGFFKEQGLNVTITDFGGGAKSLQSLIGGSADVVTGAYEHTIRMQAKGQDIAAVIELGRFPGIVLAVRKDKAAQVKSFKDLKGFKIGVTAPGSSTNFFVNALIAREGLKADDVAIIGVGTGLSAVAAMKKGELDAMSNLDPVITKLVQDGDVVVIADSRTEEGNMKLFGGNNPAAVVYLKRDFIAKNPVTTQAIVSAFYKTTKWLEKASPEDVVKVVPEEYWLGDRALYLAAVTASKPMYSTTGVIPPQGMTNALGMLTEFDPELKDVKIDLAKTFDDRFVKKAAGVN